MKSNIKYVVLLIVIFSCKSFKEKIETDYYSKGVIKEKKVFKDKKNKNNFIKYLYYPNGNIKEISEH